MSDPIPNTRNLRPRTTDANLLLEQSPGNVGQRSQSVLSDTASASASAITSSDLERILTSQQSNFNNFIVSQQSTLNNLISALPGLMSQSITDSVSERCVSTPPVIKKLKVQSWSDNQQPSAYLAKYEQVLTANDEPKAKWAHLLPIYISGSLQAAFQADITPDLLDSYDSVKEILLEAMGDTASQAARKWWTVVREPDKSYNALYHTLNHRRLEPLGDNKQDIPNFITLSKFTVAVLP